MGENGSGNLLELIDRYQFGGQAGANTGQKPQPKGEWTHHQQTGPSGDFTFHAGTASGPEGTNIVEIRCSDPDFWFPARPRTRKTTRFWRSLVTSMVETCRSIHQQDFDLH